MDSSDGRAFLEGGGAMTGSLEKAGGSTSGRSREDTLEYIGALAGDLRVLAEGVGAERLATLLALARYEVRSQLSRTRKPTRP